MIRVLVADDHPTMRQSIRYSLNRDRDVAVIAEASTAQQALRLAQQHTPDVAVLDIEMPGQSGVDIIRDLRRLGTRVVVFSAHCGRGTADAVRDAGAEGYVVKVQPERDLLQAVRAVAAGRARWGVVPNAPEETASALTDRESDVLSLLTRGLSNEHIADFLAITEGTVRNVLSRTYHKIGVTTSREALVWAHSQGFGYRPLPSPP